MGIFGWGYWLGEHIEKLKLLRELAKDEKEVAMLDELIADAEKKKGK